MAGTFSPDTIPQNNYLFINTQGTSLIKNSSGVLVSVVIGTKDALGTGTVTIYDGVNSSGNIMMTLSTGILSSPAVINLNEGINFLQGLFVVVAGSPVTAPSITIVYL